MSRALSLREASKDEITMAIESKASFLNQFEHKLGDFLPANSMRDVLAAAADILEHFSVSEIIVTEDTATDMLDGYFSALKVQGRSGKTLYQYERILKRMLAFAGVPIREITVHHLRDYLTAERERGIADGTLENNRQTFSAFFGWLKEEGLIEKNPATNLRKIKQPKKKKEILSEAQIEKLIRACDCSRDRAVISFLATTGCRVSEMTGLDRAGINLMTRSCVVYGKGDKERTVYFSDVTAMYLKEYFDERDDGCDALFAGRIGERLLPDGVRVMLNRVARRAGVKHVHPHMFRRTLATNLAKHGMPVHEISVILGHDKVETTMRYVMLDENDTRNSYRKYA